MQTLERAIIEPEGWYFIETKLTAAGRKKVEEFHASSFAKSEAELYSAEDFCADIETNSTDQLLHPVCKTPDFYINLVHGVDYVLEFQCKEAFELALIAKGLNDLHDVMQEEMARLGW